jgi:hypothetical protein
MDFVKACFVDGMLQPICIIMQWYQRAMFVILFFQAKKTFKGSLDAFGHPV